MPYIPNQQTNNIIDLRDMHFSVVEFVNQILTYYQGLTVVDPNFCREMQNAKVVLGYSEESLTQLNTGTGIESLISIYYDQDDLSSISLPYLKGRHLSDQFRIPYLVYIRTLKVPNATTFSQSNEYMRISKMFEILCKAMTNDNFTITVVPSSILYNTVAQVGLSDDPVTINSGSNTSIGNYSIQEEFVKRQYAVGRWSFVIHLRQNKL